MPQGSGTFQPKEQEAAGLLLLSRPLTPFQGNRRPVAMVTRLQDLGEVPLLPQGSNSLPFGSTATWEKE